MQYKFLDGKWPPSPLLGTFPKIHPIWYIYPSLNIDNNWHSFQSLCYWLTLILAVFQLLQYKTMIGPEPNNQTKELRIRTSFFFSFIRLRHINQAVFYDRTESYHGSDLLWGLSQIEMPASKLLSLKAFFEQLTN